MPLRFAFGRTLPMLLAVLFTAVLAPAQSLKPYVEGDRLHLRGSGVRLLSAEARQQLRNGATVTYAFRVSVMGARGTDVRGSLSYHCVFSFDLWEEKYKVVRLEPGYRSASNLNQMGAEQFCLEALVLPVATLPAAGFWISMAYQMQDPHSPDSNEDSRSIPGMLIDIFSRRSKDSLPIEVVESGPFRLDDLRKAR